MKYEVQTSKFNYDVLDDNVKQIVQQATSEINQLSQTVAESIIRIGNHLIAIKKHLRHGQFGDWLASEVAFSERTAQNWMQVATRFKSANVADLDTLSSTTLYLLSSPSTPDSAIEEVIEQAKKTDSLSRKQAKQIVQKHKDTHHKVASGDHPHNSRRADKHTQHVQSNAHDSMLHLDAQNLSELIQGVDVNDMLYIPINSSEKLEVSRSTIIEMGYSPVGIIVLHHKNHTKVKPASRQNENQTILSDLEKIDGVGLSTAQTLITQFGEDVFNVIDHEDAISQLQQIEGIGASKAEQICLSWQKIKRGENGRVKKPNWNYQVYELLKEYEPNINMQQTLRDAKKLKGYTLEEIRGYVEYWLTLKWFREKAIPLNSSQVVKSIARWKQVGSPANESDTQLNQRGRLKHIPLDQDEALAELEDSFGWLIDLSQAIQEVLPHLSTTAITSDGESLKPYALDDLQGYGRYLLTKEKFKDASHKIKVSTFKNIQAWIDNGRPATEAEAIEMFNNG